jgi:hypothetical protein
MSRHDNLRQAFRNASHDDSAIRMRAWHTLEAAGMGKTYLVSQRFLHFALNPTGKRLAASIEAADKLADTADTAENTAAAAVD